MKRNGSGAGALVLLVLLAAGALLSACGEGTEEDSVLADSVPGKQPLELEVPCKLYLGNYPAYGGNYFSVDRKLDELLSIAESAWGEEHVTLLDYGAFSSVGSCVLIRTVDDGGTANYYLIEKLKEQDLFLFYGMGAELVTRDAPEEFQTDRLLLHFHFIDDARISGLLDPKLYAGAEYQLAQPLEDRAEWPGDLVRFNVERFADFYQGTQYGVEASGDGLVLRLDGAEWVLSFAVHADHAFMTVDRGGDTGGG